MWFGEILGSCPYKECEIGDWSEWVDISDDECPTQERTRNFTSTTEYEEQEDDCTGVGPKECPPEQKENRETG